MPWNDHRLSDEISTVFYIYIHLLAALFGLFLGSMIDINAMLV